MIYNAMFDEVDEGTAMYKIAATSADVPEGLQVVTMDTDGECFPSDWYLQLAGEATKMLRGEIPLAETIPISPPANPGTCESSAFRIRLQVSTTSDWTTIDFKAIQIDTMQIISSSPEASDASIDQNLLVLAQSIEQANTGQLIEMVVDLFPAGLGESTLNITIGRGNIGATSVEMYAMRGPDATLVKTLQWSGIGADGQNLENFEVPGSLFGAAP